MGIPTTWNIAREDAKDKDVLRADVMGQRSPIRRRIRPSRSPRPRSAFDPDYLFSTSRFAPYLEPPSLSSHSRTRLAPPPVPEVSRSVYRSSESSRAPPTLQREDSGLRPPTTLFDGFGYMRAYETRQALDSDRPLPAFTPGFGPATLSRTPEEALRDDARNIARMPGQNYYHPTSDSRPTRSQSTRANHSSMRRSDSAHTAEDEHEHESSDSNAVSFAPLRRMGRRNIADGPLPASSLRESWSPVSTIDGLGDRERSLSPPSENLPWDTFLSTVVPDPHVPTAESSFASAAAAASFSNSQPSSRAGSANTSASSSQTHMTVPSRRHSPPTNEQFMRACDTSEDDTASDTEVEDDEDGTAGIGEWFRLHYNPVNTRRHRPSLFADEPPRRDNERYSRRVMARSRDASSYVRSFYNPSHAPPRSLRGVMSSPSRASRTRDVVDGPQLEQLDGAADGPVLAGEEDIFPLISMTFAPLDQELREARLLLERLSRREDVSDDFWASVGLTRSFADRVESFNERERL
ncbi:hypothetical protein GQ44DRAFT_700852 [Phaeosphaeriaceae sp. PMI808]|nr:hypothetical protein GQ44DRAFT_700852 [Phaeosphaeriaceae sp. PMI808]